MVALLLHLLMASLTTVAEVSTSGSSGLALTRVLTGSGFHRNVETTVIVPQRMISSQQKSLSCAFLLFETLPPGVYADPFQLQSLVPFGGPEVLFDRVVNVEAAESLSKPHELFIYLPLSEHRLDAELSEISLEVSVPVHARYLRPSSDPNVYHSVVTILHPGLYYNCSSSGAADIIMAPCDVANSSVCRWTHLGYKSDSPVLQLLVPTGQQKHAPFVVMTTLLVTVTVCALLAKAIWTSQKSVCDKSS